MRSTHVSTTDKHTMAAGLMILAMVLLSTTAHAAAFTLTVNGGSGGGVHEQGTDVRIWANPYDTASPDVVGAESSNPASPNRVFDVWLGDTAFLQDPTASDTRLIMPGVDVTVTASYKDAARWTAPRVVVDIPTGHAGLIFFFHGRGGCASCLFGKTESLKFIQDAVARGFGIVAIDSFDRVDRSWSDDTDPITNIDIQRVLQARNELIAQARISANDPVFLVGISNGGKFASLLAKASETIKDFSVDALALHISAGAASVMPSLTVPTIFALTDNDSMINTGTVESYLSSFITRGIEAALLTKAPSPVHPRRFWRIEGMSALNSESVHAALSFDSLLDANNFVLPAAFSDGNGNGSPDWQDVLPSEFTRVGNEILSQLLACYAEHEFYSGYNNRLLDFLESPYTAVDDMPTVESMSSSSGTVGTLVTIDGSQFIGVSDVRFNGVSAAFQTISSTHVNATVPAGAGTGPIELVAYAGSSTSADDFVVVQAPPVITSFSPTTVAVGYVVTIIGENFTNAELVGFRPYVYGAFTVISDTQIQVTVPAGARTGKLGVQTRAGTVISASRIKVP